MPTPTCDQCGKSVENETGVSADVTMNLTDSGRDDLQLDPFGLNGDYTVCSLECAEALLRSLCPDRVAGSSLRRKRQL